MRASIRQGASDLVIEIALETTRKTDEIIKRKLYSLSRESFLLILLMVILIK